jgi:long-chain fatty acid transport protein
MKFIHKVSRVGTVVLFGLLVGISDASGFRNPPETAQGLALDGGKIAAVKDASAIGANPANIVGIERPNLIGSLTLIHSEAEFESAPGTATTDDPWKALPNLFFAFPVEANQMSLGVALTTPFGQSTVWEKDSILRYSAPYESELSIVNVNPTFALRTSDRSALGLGLDVFSGELILRQFLPWARVTGNPAAPDGLMKFDADGSGVGLNMGFRYDLTERQQVGLVYRSPVKVEMEGDFRVNNIPDLRLAAPKSDFETEIEFPAIAAAGYGIRIDERLHVGADVEWIEFSRFDQLPVDIGVNNALLPSPAIPQNWSDTWTFGVAAEYRIDDSWALRGGYKFLESPIPSSTLAPSLPDADRHLVTAGVGYRAGAHRVDAAYAYSIFDDRTASGLPDPTLNGIYELSSHLFVITYGIEL